MLVLLLLLLLLSAVFLIFIYLKLYVPNQFWKKKGIPYAQPRLLFGNLASFVLGQKTYDQTIRDIYKKFESHRYFGIYQSIQPNLAILDLDLIKRICVKDFDSFTDHSDFMPEYADPFTKKGLLNRNGKAWHDMRVILSPAFTSRKMKAMFQLMIECSERLVKHFSDEPGILTVEMRDIFTRFANDAIASCTFGITCDSLKDKNNEFYLMGQEAFDFTGWKSIKFFGYALSPIVIKLFGLTFFSEKVRNFFVRITKETISYREETGLVRPDMIHLLKEAQKGRLDYEADDDKSYVGFASVEESDLVKLNRSKTAPISDEDIAIQALTFFFGGYDTVSIVLCQLAYELAVHMDIQEKLIEEVDITLQQCNGQITYDALMKMKYLDMVISETLRLWSPGQVINRLCVKPFVIEPISPDEKEIIVELGTQILIPIDAIRKDPKYFNNPTKFDPERFSDENKGNINPYTYLPFGIGPRHCIGNRFALMEMKTILFCLLRNFQIVPVEKTVIPFVPQKRSILLRSAHGYWFGLKRRTHKV